MSQITYEAAVFTRTVKYKNFKGDTVETDLHFALDPLSLMQAIASFSPKAAKKSANPARRNDVSAVTDEEQVKFVRDLAGRAAGFPSDDGESWEPFTEFEDSIAGKAFLTMLVSSDANRKEFSEKVLIDPFRSFVEFAHQDESNSKKELAQFDDMLKQIESIFAGDEAKADESLEERRARLQAEMAALDVATDGVKSPLE